MSIIGFVKIIGVEIDGKAIDIRDGVITVEGNELFDGGVKISYGILEWELVLYPENDFEMKDQTHTFNCIDDRGRKYGGKGICVEKNFETFEMRFMGNGELKGFDIPAM